MDRLTRNRARCLRCGDVIESTHTHDLRWCSCRGLFVDGGLSYTRRGTMPGVDYEEMSVANATRLLPTHLRRNFGGRCKSWLPRGAGWADPPPVVRCTDVLGGYVGGEPIARCAENLWWRVCCEVRRA